MTTTTIWNLYYLPDKKVISPGETLHIRLDLHNPTTQYLYISDIAVDIPWLRKPWCIQPKQIVAPNERRNLVSFNLPIPDHVVGRREIRFHLQTFQHDSAFQRWLLPQWISSKPPMEIWTVCLPRYRAFVSRSNRECDKPVVEPIVEMIQQWGFETKTVGINIFEEEPERISKLILTEIVRADCLIGIVTPRDLSALDGFWKTFTWLASEASMAFTMDKPIFLIVDKMISTEGFIAQKHLPKVSFFQLDLPRLYADLCCMMPGFRKWIENRKRTEFFRALQNVISGEVEKAFVLGVGYAAGKRKS